MPIAVDRIHSPRSDSKRGDVELSAESTREYGDHIADRNDFHFLGPHIVAVGVAFKHVNSPIADEQDTAGLDRWGLKSNHCVSSGKIRRFRQRHFFGEFEIDEETATCQFSLGDPELRKLLLKHQECRVIASTSTGSRRSTSVRTATGTSSGP